MPYQQSDASAERHNHLKRGPKEERLKIEGDWEKAVGDALKKKRPEGGWPDPDKKSTPDKE